MYIPKHPNYIKSSNLMFLSTAIALISYLLLPDYFTSTKIIIGTSIGLLVCVGLAFLVRQGIDWVKYLLLVLFVLGCIGLPFILLRIIENPISGSISIVQTIIQLWAVVLLFKVPPVPKSNSMQQFRDSISTKNDESL